MKLIYAGNDAIIINISQKKGAYMKEECLICKAPLEYLETDELMECAVCHKKENSKTRCILGHYVCNECHTAGLDTIIGLCLNETSKDPVAIIRKMMDIKSLMVPLVNIWKIMIIT